MDANKYLKKKLKIPLKTKIICFIPYLNVIKNIILHLNLLARTEFCEANAFKLY